ncbi:DUF4760 domain-containing protein [Marinimicrobium sp. ARAG 43.8]|uniref:DUF4760 domain-containing protein n=1 Tax=Marinimicrobium sp. ARAG 43.8 TaxID=3418719 RepID=UPI003CF6241B
MKLIINIGLFVTGLLLVAAVGATWRCGEPYNHFLGPLAILTSALIAIRVAVMNIESAQGLSKENRTVEFVTKEYPLAGEKLKHISSAERKLVEGSSHIIKKRLSRTDMRLEIEKLDSLIQSLSDDERGSLSALASYFEIISINIANGYFSSKIVNEHLGSQFGVHFWARVWPFIVYTKHMNTVYSNLKGLPISESVGAYVAFERRILENAEIKNPYPRKSERMVDGY